MNLQEQVSSVAEKYIELLPVGEQNFSVGSEQKASKFLIASVQLAGLRDKLLNAKIKKDSMVSIAYNQAIANAEGKDATARSAAAKANPAYLSAEEDAALIENQLIYIKSLLDIFNNAHLLYRALLKNEA